MNVSFIGSGNVATHLALALYRRGDVIDQVYSPNPAHAALLAGRVEAEAVGSLQLMRRDADVYILAIPDNALYDVVLDFRTDDALVLHTSGTTAMEVLKDTSTRYGVLWSPQSFVRDAAVEYDELPFCIEGNTPRVCNDIAAFIGRVSTHVFRTTQEQRQWLHLSAVFVNNFQNGLTAIAQKLCREHEVPFEVLHPIMLTTTQRAFFGDVRYQLTGPAVRNDSRTLATHRRMLGDDKELLAVYDMMSEILKHIKSTLPQP